jgi:cyclohexanecarboxylate-CoA ligase
VPQQIVREVPATLGVPLRALRGMTEVAAQTWTRAGDPVDWGTQSDGSPGSGLEIDLRPETDGTERPARLFVRGAGVTLATLGRDSGSLNVLADHNDGWYDTGDLVIPDGRGGARTSGPRSRFIGRPRQPAAGRGQVLARHDVQGLPDDGHGRSRAGRDRVHRR